MKELTQTNWHELPEKEAAGITLRLETSPGKIFPL